MDQQAKNLPQIQIYRPSTHKLDNGMELTIEYLPERKLLQIWDYLIIIKDEDLKNPNYSLTVKEFYLILVDSLWGYDEEVTTDFSSTGEIKVVINVPIKKQSVKIDFTFKMLEQEQTQKSQFAKLSRKINQLQTLKNEHEEQKFNKINLNRPITVPVFSKNQKNSMYYNIVDKYTVVRESKNSNNYYALFAENPLRPKGIQTFKVKVLRMQQQPTPYLLIGVAIKSEIDSLRQSKQAYFISCYNGHVNNEIVSQTYANYPSIHNGDMITVTVDMDLGLINFQLPSPLTNKKVKMTSFIRTECYPYVELYGAGDSVKFVE